MNGRVVIVTGSGQGIGRASALRFAAAGAKVVVADLNPASGEETAELVRQQGGEAAFVKANVTVENDVAAMVAFAVEAFGRLDCAHNNAGGRGAESPVMHETTEAEWNELVDLNLKSAWLCMKHEVIHMLEHGGGSIVNTGSAASYLGSQSATWYVGAKHGLVGLSKSTAYHYASQGIRVNMVCPGVTDTELVVGRYGREGAEALAARLNPIARLIGPHEIADAAVWLCSDAAAAITGAVVPVDGGMSTV